MDYPIRYTLLALAIITTIGCKDKPGTRDIPVPVGSKGGAATLKITPKHHERNIDSCMVYIAYARELPANGKYDDSARCVQENGKPVATFTGLKSGAYYLYGYGYDPAIAGYSHGGNGYIIEKETVIEYVLNISGHVGH